MRMLTALDAPPDALDEEERFFVDQIREHGWFRTSITGDDEGPGFSFSTGFWLSAGHPELIMFSVKRETAHAVFHDLFRQGRDGQILTACGRTDAAFANLPAYAFPVAKRHYEGFLGWSRWFYGGDDFPVLQLVWPDPAGRFPWEEGFDAKFAADQPDLSDRGWLSEIVESRKRRDGAAG